MNHLKKLIYTAIFLAMGFVLPMLIGQIPTLGKALLPMHIPVFLCAMICGWQYGALIGCLLPLLRSLIFGVPTMYPTAIAVAFEMFVYGFVSGLIFDLFKKKNIISIYSSRLPAMILGRIVRCIAEIILLGIKGTTFVWKSFAIGVILNSTPGIILQLILIPAVILTLKKIRILKFDNQI